MLPYKTRDLNHEIKMISYKVIEINHVTSFLIDPKLKDEIRKNTN
jgi:hypothetical protein